jgi:hypothetical protein
MMAQLGHRPIPISVSLRMWFDSTVTEPRLVCLLRARIAACSQKGPLCAN